MPSFENQHMPNTRGPRSTQIHYTGAQNFHVKEFSHTGPGIILLNLRNSGLKRSCSNITQSDTIARPFFF